MLAIVPLFIGATELMLIAGIALLLFGGKKLPEMMRELGQGIREFKKGTLDKCYLFVLVAILLSGCKRETVNVLGIVAERDSIKEASIRQQQELDNLNAFVSAVSNGLDSIAMQEGLIRIQNPESPGMTREQMKKSLAELSDMLARQRIRIAQLEDSLKVKGTGAEGLHKIVEYLNEQLEAKEKVINQLRTEVNNKNTNIARLESRITTLNENVERLDKKSQIQQQALVTQSDMMNECYMKIGTKKQLKQAGIMDRKKLNAGGLTPDKFVRVDIRQLRELPLKSKKPKILTTMPQSSYSIVRNSDGTSLLTIDDPTLFWSSSNYLVILLD